VDHRGGRDKINRRTERRFAGEAMIGDVRAVEEGEIVGAVHDALEGVIGIVKVELDPAVSADERRADRAADVEIEAGRLPPVGRLADEARTRDTAAADDAGGLDAIDDRASLGEGARSEREDERERCATASQLYAGSVAGSELNPSGITFGIPWRTSSGVTPIAAQPMPPWCGNVSMTASGIIA
jgi:hypothetical protein